jgi:hypothetical protein
MTCRPIFRQRQKYAHATMGKVLQDLFSMWSAPCPLLGNRSLNIPAEADARNNRSVARQRRGKQALLTIQAVFSMESVKS